MRQLAGETLRVNLVDESGLWPGGNIPFETGDVLFELAPMEFPPFARSEAQGSMPCLQAVKKVIFSAISLDEFAKSLEKAAQVLAQEKAAYESQLASLRSLLAQRTATVLLRDSGRLTSRMEKNGFVAQTKFPEKIQINHGSVNTGAEGTLTLISRSVRQLLPQHYSYSNSDLDLLLQGEIVKITNKTNSYVSLDALTLYHQENVLTLGGDKFREIAPGAYFTFPLTNFDLRGLRTDHAGLTRERAKLKSVEFGFACKYRRNDLTQARSFVEIKSYRLLDLVMAQKFVAQR